MFFLWLFGPFPGHVLPCSLPPVTHMSCGCPPVFRIAQLAESFRISSSQLFLGLPTGLLPQKFPFKLCFGFLLSIILTTCSAHCKLSTLIHVARSLSLYILYSATWYRIIQTPLSFTSPNILRIIFLSRNRLCVRPFGKVSICHSYKK
jgi:hypothetical protein